MMGQEQPLPVPANESAEGAPPNPLVTAPWSEGDLTYWRSQIEKARKLRDDTIAAWDSKGNLERYTPKTVMKDGQPSNRVNVAKDFADVERKNAALFYNTPQISLVPDPGTNQVALDLHSELLNTLMGEDYMDVLSTVSPTIQDCLVAIQPSPTEIGYSSVSVNVEQPVPVIDPATQAPAIDPMTGQPMTQLQSVPVVVWEEFFWTKISPKAVLIPVDQKNTKYDKAPWQGYDFRKPISQLRKEFAVPEDVTPTDVGEKPYFDPLTDQTDNSEPMGGGVKLWYRAHTRDVNVSHPEVIRELVLLEGMDVPVVHRNLPYQTIGDDGRLTPDSIIGFPGHPLALRSLTDSPYVAADCTITAPLTRELNKYRTQNIRQREASKLHYLVDASKLNPEVRDKIGSGNEPMMIVVEPGVLDAGADKAMAQLPRLEQGRESYLGQDIIERDRAQILGIDANQVGSQSKGGKTATEVSTVQRNADARFERERMQATRWFLRGVQKLSAIVLRYGDRMAMDILGPERGKAWVDAKNQGLIARFKFRTVMDSGNYVDISERTRQDVQAYNLTAKDPMTNRQVLLARIATDLGLDPSQWIVTKQPEQKPESPNLSIAVKPEDLDPALPSYVGTHAILTAAGIKGLPPPLPQPMAPPVMVNPAEHGGMAPQAERLNQHQLSETGERSGPAVM
jgi:hypothetical protein